MIKVLVVDDHDLVRMGISRMLSDSIDIEVIGEADSGDMARKIREQSRPDVVLLDVNMPNIGGLEATKRLIQLDMGIKILAVSSMSASLTLLCLSKRGSMAILRRARRSMRRFALSKKSIRVVVILAKMSLSNWLMFCCQMPTHPLTY